ncbi:MAG: hypothetical protein ABI604_16925, partial [Nitrospirota bacterium]
MTKRLQEEGPSGDDGRPNAEGESLLNRRRLLAGTAGLVGAMLMGSMRSSAEATTEGSREDPTRVPGAVPTAYG